MIIRLLRLAMSALFTVYFTTAAVGQESSVETDLDSLLAVDQVSVDQVEGTKLREARGIVEAGWEAVLSSEVAGRIINLPFDEGDHFSEGDELVGFDCAFYRAALNESQATLQAAQKTLDVNKQLAEFNAVSILEVSLAEAEVIRAGAAVRSRQLVVNRCSLVAPADGWVVARHVSMYESAAEGGELLSVVGDDELRVRLIVPSDWLVWMQPGGGFLFQVDETGADYFGTLEKTGARVDPASQTLTVFGQLQGDVGALIPGMSGTATFGAEAQDP